MLARAFDGFDLYFILIFAIRDLAYTSLDRLACSFFPVLVMIKQTSIQTATDQIENTAVGNHHGPFARETSEG